MAKGVLLMNIGSPASYDVADVKRYLRTFLMDKDIINAPFFVRWPLVNFAIIPKRSPQSAKNYESIWMPEGSPLLVYSKRFAKDLQQKLGPEYIVELGMRYSEPSISSALKKFAKAQVSEIIAVPMYPQYAEATTGSSLKELRRQMEKHKIDIPLKIRPPFFAADFFIKPAAQIAKQALGSKKIDHFLFSFHGLPESQVKKVSGCLLTPDCCLQKNSCAKNCYRAHCFATATAMAKEMDLNSNQWTVSFQSRLGKVEWIKPYTDLTLKRLAESGVKNVAVLCPSFVADCIETLEEIGIGEKAEFLSHGGAEYLLVPCVNDDPAWVRMFASFVTDTNS